MKRFAALLFLVLATAASAPSGQPTPRLFADYALLKLNIDAPLDRLFSLARRTNDGVTVDGTIRYTDPSTRRNVTIAPVKIGVRGNTSRRDSECTFPKLRIDFQDGTVPRGSLFDGTASVKIGTHCGERPDGALTKLGRWANDKAPVREAFVYRLLEAVGVPTLKARPAEIEYERAGQPPLVRHAMLLEDEHAAILRLGGSGELKGFRNARENFAVDDSSGLAFAEAMIGNFDWSVKFSADDYYRADDTHPLWNVMAVARRDGTAFPVIYDFDLAGPVAGSHPWFARVYFDGFLPSRSHPAIEVLGQVQRTRTLFPRSVLDRARRRFVQARPAAYRALDDAVLDDAGRRFARAYLDTFYEAITPDEAFYRPAIVKSGTVPYASGAGGAAACGRGDRVPVGTGVGEALARTGARVQVALLDVWWHWASRCDVVHQGPVWVDASAIGHDFEPASSEPTPARATPRRSPSRRAPHRDRAVPPGSP